MYSPRRVSPYPSPTRSTPCLDYEPQGYESPPDDYLATPDVSEWREVRRLEDQKILNEQLAAIETSYQYELPSLDTLSHNQRPLLSELPPQLPPWPHSTISPKEAFHDYQEVHKFLQDQARPASPSTCSDDSSSFSSPYSPYNALDLYFDDDSSISASPQAHAQTTPSTSTQPSVSPVPSRRVGKKSKREESDDEYAPASKRCNTGSHYRSSLGDDDDNNNDDLDGDNDNAVEFEDESGDFRPVRRVPQPQRRKPKAGPRRPTRPATARPRKSAVHRAARNPKANSNRGKAYVEGHCDCQEVSCTSCQMTCFYTFVHGERQGQVCRRVFESGRYLDLRRHKISHAVQEGKLLEAGEITLDMAGWYSVDFGGKEQVLICPIDDCSTTFTRYDALKRHIEHKTCDSLKQNDIVPKGLDNRGLKAWINQLTDDKLRRLGRL